MTEVKKRDYSALEGEVHPENAARGGIVTQQPTAMSSMDSYVLDLDATQVAGWTPEEVINNFVEKIGLGYLNEAFLANKITGKALMLLNEGMVSRSHSERESHLKEMDVRAIGDRVYLLDMISKLKKKKMELETTAALWSGETPAEGIAYSDGCGQCIARYICPCCVARTYWKVTGQGVFYRRVPPFRRYFGTVSTEFMDYRFFKDLELKEGYACCCCCKRFQLEMYVDDKDSKASERKEETPGFPTPHVLLHPDAAKVEHIIRNAWSSARLVAE